MSAHSTRRKIELEDLDETILERISEQDAQMWMAVRLKKLKESIPCASSLELQADFRHYGSGDYYDTDFSGHALNVCALTHQNVSSVEKELREKLLDNPAEKAEEKRRKARIMIQEAEKLEELANSKEPVSHRRNS